MNENRCARKCAWSTFCALKGEALGDTHILLADEIETRYDFITNCMVVLVVPNCCLYWFAHPTTIASGKFGSWEPPLPLL